MLPSCAACTAICCGRSGGVTGGSASSATGTPATTASSPTAESAESIPSRRAISTSSEGAAGCAGSGRRMGRRLLTTAVTARWRPDCATSGASNRGGAGLVTGARDGALRNPMSSNSATFALRAAVDVPPKTVAMIRSWPRCADATRLNPAALV